MDRNKLTLSSQILLGLKEIVELLPLGKYVGLYWHEDKGVYPSNNEAEIDAGAILLINEADLSNLLDSMPVVELRWKTSVLPRGIYALAEYIAGRLTSRDPKVQQFLQSNCFVGQCQFHATERELSFIRGELTV